MEEKINILSELVQVHLIDNKAWGGLFMIGCGLLFLMAAIRDWNWVFGNVSKTTYSLAKLDGIINKFGRKTGRVFAGIGGVVVILCGIGWTYLCIAYPSVWKSK